MEVPIRWVRRLIILLFSGCIWGQDTFQVHGYIQGRFTNQEGTPDRLEIRRARVIFSGDPWAKLSYRFQVDVVKKPYIMDASLTWKFSPVLAFTAGQFKIPFSAESLIADNLNAPVARARVVNSLAPGRDTGVQGRDTGAQVAGSLGASKSPLVEYTAGVFRGQTLVYSPAVHYNATAGRVLIHPASGLTLGGDWYGSFSAPASKEKRREEAEGSFERGPLKLRAEQIWARDGTLKRRGGYALGVWKLSPHWEAVTRADWLTTNVQKANTTSVAYIAGANYYLWKHVKIGSNAGAQHDQGPKDFSSVFLAQVMLSF
jgi:phosphate-selective porin OprO/OprP